MANSKVLFNPKQSPAVVKSSNHVAAGVHEFHELLGIESGRESSEARRWREAASERWDSARAAGASSVETVKNFGGETRDQVRSVKDKLSKRIAEARKIDAVLDLVGNSTILDSLDMLRRGGRACLAGWLCGLAPIHDFNPLLQMASGVYLTFFGSFVFGKPGFPLSDVPLQALAADVAAGRYRAKPSRVFRFEDIREAHRVIDANQANGKLVVVL